jgi:hypothetical protein
MKVHSNLFWFVRLNKNKIMPINHEYILIGKNRQNKPIATIMDIL